MALNLLAPPCRPESKTWVPRNPSVGGLFFNPAGNVLEVLRMWMESDSIYFFRRARQEREAARRAVHPEARQAHLAMARRFDSLSEAIAARETQ
jgi:hypothetical protein